MKSLASAAPMNGFLIKIDDLSGPEIVALLNEHLECMAKVSPPESRHALNLDGLRKPDITFWTVWQGQQLVGCGALKELEAYHCGIKTNRTTTAHHRKGNTARVLQHHMGA